MPANDQSRPAHVLRVLLVEDENLVALLLEDMVAELGHSVIGPVGRLNKALELAQRESIDVAILDVNIHGEQSYPIAEALAARNIPFIFSTGYENGSLPAQYRGCRTLQKPFQQHQLERLLAEIIP